MPASRLTTPLFIACGVVLLAAALLMGIGFGSADPGGPDDGLLHLAGATALLRGEDYPLVQRPPLYSAVIALAARLTGVSTVSADSIVPEAQELGSIDFFGVAAALHTESVLRTLLWLNIICWLTAALLTLLTLRHLKLGTVGLIIATAGLLLPSSWRMVGIVSETTLCQLLVAVGVYAAARSWRRNSRQVVWWLVAGTAFALLAFTKPTFQLLSPLLIVAALIFVPLLNRRAFGFAIRAVVLILIPWIVIVGGWSLRNQSQHGFLGMSGVGGVALSTRTALYVERGAEAFPEEAPVFAQIRDELFVQTPQKPDVVYWGARASNWLMSARGLSYLDANRFLTAYNLAAIRAAPLNYLLTTAQSAVYFQFPSVDADWPTVLRLIASGLELVWIVVFWLIALLWLSLHVLAKLGWLTKHITTADALIALSVLICLYTMAVSSAVDVGKPEHRLPVQMLTVIVIVLAMARSRFKPHP